MLTDLVTLVFGIVKPLLPIVEVVVLGGLNFFLAYIFFATYDTKTATKRAFTFTMIVANIVLMLVIMLNPPISPRP